MLLAGSKLLICTLVNRLAVEFSFATFPGWDRRLLRNLAEIVAIVILEIQMPLQILQVTELLLPLLLHLFELFTVAWITDLP